MYFILNAIAMPAETPPYGLNKEYFIVILSILLIFGIPEMS